jgi:hypothetical protein
MSAIENWSTIFRDLNMNNWSNILVTSMENWSTIFGDLNIMNWSTIFGDLNN